MSVNIVFIESTRAFLVLLSFDLNFFHRTTSSYSNNSMEANPPFHLHYFFVYLFTFLVLFDSFEKADNKPNLNKNLNKPKKAKKIHKK